MANAGIVILVKCAIAPATPIRIAKMVMAAAAGVEKTDSQQKSMINKNKCNEN